MGLEVGSGWRRARVSARSAIIWAGRGCLRGEGGGRREVLRGEALVEQLGDDAAAGDEVGHGDGEVAVGVFEGGFVADLGGVADEAFGEGEGERRDAVDDYEGVADGEGLDGGGAAGDDGGAGVVEGGAGVWHEGD